MKFSELQQFLEENLGINHLADIARELGVSPQAVSNWKSRDRVPYKYVLKIRRQLEESDTQVSNQSKSNSSDSNQGFPQYEYPQYFEKDTISLMDILLILAKHLRLIIIIPIILCILAKIYVEFYIPPVYVSKAKIMSAASNASTSQAAALASRFGLNPLF